MCNLNNTMGAYQCHVADYSSTARSSLTMPHGNIMIPERKIRQAVNCLSGGGGGIWTQKIQVQNHKNVRSFTQC